MCGAQSATGVKRIGLYVEILHFSSPGSDLGVSSPHQTQFMERAVKSVLISFILSLSISQFSYAEELPLTCQIGESVEESSFFNAVVEQIDSGISTGEYSHQVKDKYQQMKLVFQTTSKDLCALDQTNGAKSERHRLVSLAVEEIEIISKTATGEKTDDEFIALVAGLFSRAIARL